jgi:hypothetical protein
VPRQVRSPPSARGSGAIQQRVQARQYWRLTKKKKKIFVYKAKSPARQYFYVCPEIRTFARISALVLLQWTSKPVESYQLAGV